jgi:hypothetical protein
VDVTYSALGQLGYNEHNFPTDSEVKATYLGKNRPRQTGSVVQTAQAAPTPLTKGAEQGGYLPNFNQQSYQEAVQHAAGERAAASLFTSPEDSVLRQALLRAGAPPNAGAYGSIVKIGGGPVATPQTASQGTSQSGAPLNGFIPKGTSYHLMRTDQGKDVQLKPGQPLLATGHYEVVAVPSDPSGFGPAYPVVKFLSGPDAGHTIYLGHTDSEVHVGQTGKAGDILARTSRTGHNAPPGWVEIGLWGPNGPLAAGQSGETSAGKQIARLLGAG